MTTQNIKINHIAIVVADMDKALNFWQQALGLPLQHTERNEAEAVDIAFLPVGEGEIELIKPITEDSGVAKYLAKTGGGMHHLCLESGKYRSGDGPACGKRRGTD